MKDEARNSLLKLLEEPPETISIVLTAVRRESMIPTVLSRLRPYRFNTRSAEDESEIIRRIFRDTGTGLEAYLGQFMPQPPEKLLPLAAFFVAAAARSAATFAKGRGVSSVSVTLAALGSYCAPIAEAADLVRTSNIKETIAMLISHSGNFEGRSFARFLAVTLDLVSKSLAQDKPSPGHIACREIWKKRIGEAQASYGVWNQRPEPILESLFYRLREELAAV